MSRHLLCLARIQRFHRCLAASDERSYPYGVDSILTSSIHTVPVARTFSSSRMLA